MNLKLMQMKITIILTKQNVANAKKNLVFASIKTQTNCERMLIHDTKCGCEGITSIHFW